MLCQNCNKREANVKYTEIINGEKKEMHLCEECSEKLGINNISFDMPINFSNFFDDIFNDYEEDFMPLLEKTKTLKCNNCGMTYDEFLKEGKFGCSNCYESFESKIEPILKRLHGETSHKGRKANQTFKKDNCIESTTTESKNKNTKRDLQAELKKAIQEERYEDAAKIRDEIKKGAK